MVQAGHKNKRVQGQGRHRTYGQWPYPREQENRSSFYTRGAVHKSNFTEKVELTGMETIDVYSVRTFWNCGDGHRCAVAGF